MDLTSNLEWHPLLADPSERRPAKPRTAGKTMVIDKGLGLGAFEDLLAVGGAHIDFIKLAFGTSPLYPPDVLKRKIELARRYGVSIMPGGTFLEVAVSKRSIADFFRMLAGFGFSALEVSDGTIEMKRNLRSDLILRGLDLGL